MNTAETLEVTENLKEIEILPNEDQCKSYLQSDLLSKLELFSSFSLGIVGALITINVIV